MIPTFEDLLTQLLDKEGPKYSASEIAQALELALYAMKEQEREEAEGDE